MIPQPPCPDSQTIFIPCGTSGFTVRGLTMLDTISLQKLHGIAVTEDEIARLHASMIAHACDELDAETNAMELDPSVTEAAMAAIIRLTAKTLSTADSVTALAVARSPIPETAH